MNHVSKIDRKFLKLAFQEAEKGFRKERGIPVGAALALNGRLIKNGLGRNRRVQDGNPIAHGEMNCLKNAGKRKNYKGVTLYTTLSPCVMCAGAIVQFKIMRVVIGENKNFKGNIKFLRNKGVEVILLNDQGCINLLTEFIRKYPKIWNEDIGEG
jgi:creatinine deaminase